jgi:hypothetical protein
MTEVIQSIPDSVKVTVATASSMASLFGLTVEEWQYVLSGIVALLFIIEKAYRFYVWAREKNDTKNPTSK